MKYRSRKLKKIESADIRYRLTRTCRIKKPEMELLFIADDFHPAMIVAFNNKGSVWRDYFASQYLFIVRGSIASIIHCYPV